MRQRLLLSAFAAVLGCADSLPPSVGGQTVDDVPRYDPPADVVYDAEPPPLGSPGLPRYDLSFTLPYNGPEQTFTVDVQPRAGRLDVHFSVDTTGSFGGEISALKTSLQNAVIPQLRERVTNLAIGVSRFADFPIRSFGLPGDRPYDLLSPVTTDLDRATRAVFTLDRPLQNGGDIPECWIEALYQIGTGQGLMTGMATLDPFRPRPDVPGSGTLGGVGFREGAARVVVNVTDAPSHDPFDYGTIIPNTHTLDQAAEALRRVNAHVIGIASGEPARAQLQTIAIATGAVVSPENGRCATGARGMTRAPVAGQCPLVFDISADGTGLGDTVIDAITRFLDTLAFRTVTGATENDPRGFVGRIEALSAAAPTGAPEPRREDRQPAGALDGVPDTFTDVTTRTRLTFRVHVRNTRAPEQEYPQLFYVRVVLLGDGLVVGERVLRIIVPEGPKPDSGVDVTRDLPTADAPADAAADAAADAPADFPGEGPSDVANEPDAPADAAPADDAPADAADDVSPDAPDDPPPDPDAGVDGSGGEVGV